MKTKKRKYGNIDGVVTLTDNPIATDNEKGTIGKITQKQKDSK